MGQSIFQSSPEFAGAIEGAQVGTVVVGGRWWGLVERRKLDAGGGGGGGGGGTQAVGPVVRPAAHAVFCMGSTVCSLSGRGAGTSAVNS